MSRLGSRGAAPLGAVAVLAILLLGAGTAAACHPTPSGPTFTVLATIPLIDAIAANTSMVFAQGVTNCSQIWAITPDGTVSLYATVPVNNSECDEGALALAPNTNCSSAPPPPSVAVAASQQRVAGSAHPACHHHHGAGDILYDIVAGRLFEITNGGTNVTQVATFYVSKKPNENLGLTYDQVGTFQHDLIVSSSAGGKVWLYNCTGTITLLTQLHTYIGGPAVAPLSFGPYGGDVIIAEKRLGEVVAVSPSGNVTNVANWSKANAVAFPILGGHHHHDWGDGEWGHGGDCGGGCAFGREHYVLFVANYTSGALEAFPASELRDYAGEGFIAGGMNQGIAAFAADGTTTLFASQTQKLSDIASVSCFPGSEGYGGHDGDGGDD